MIRIANLLSPDLDGIADALGSRLRASCGQPASFEARAGPADFQDGRIGIALVCGLAYTLMRGAQPDGFEAVAAPVVDDPRTAGSPVYFADLVVPAHSAARALADLSGSVLAVNEYQSFSGFRALEHELAARGLGRDWFGRWLHTGSHHRSLDALANGDADAAAIDSHVLLLAARRDARLRRRIRVIESFGPYPAPPVVINNNACEVTAAQLTAVLSRMPEQCLWEAGITSWRAVDDAYYDPIRAAVRDLPGLDVA